MAADTGDPGAAAALHPALVDAAFTAVVAHVDEGGDLLVHVMAEGLLVVSRPRAHPLRPSRLGA
jgi:hypothetical protein